MEMAYQFQITSLCICYTVFCSILRIHFPKTTMVIDIRTGYVEPSKLVNTLFPAECPNHGN
jgi:hypothetical protein